MSAQLTVDRLSISFGGLRALDQATLRIEPRLITGLIGPNGAGKTTLFNCITGLLRASSGRVLLETADITGLAPERVTALGIARTFQLARGFPRMSVYEHLMLYGPQQPGESLVAGFFGSSTARAREAVLDLQARTIATRLELDGLLDAPITALSGGQKKLLEIGRALMAAPKLILLDEPMAGVNPTLRNKIAAHLRALRDQGVTVALIEHDMGLVEAVCDTVHVMAEGKLLASGSFAEISTNRAVQDAYLGMRTAPVDGSHAAH
jgi:ABC-type branched-subunit amino acid transport system ATPase component